LFHKAEKIEDNQRSTEVMECRGVMMARFTFEEINE
jgi:hypothetical protein